MLDFKFIRDNKDIISQTIKNRNRSVDIEQLISVAEKRLNIKRKIEEINQKRNEAAKERNVTEGSRLKEELSKIENEFSILDKEYSFFMLQIPNVVSPDTPIGKDDNENKLIRECGKKPEFNFKPKDHQELGRDLNIIDTEKASEVAGSRFTYLKGDAVLLQFALLQFCFKTLGDTAVLQKIAKDANVSVNVTSFKFVLPPVFVKPTVLNRMGRFLAKEDHYMFPEDDLMLIGSAEHTLGPIHMDSVFNESEMPVRYAGYSTSFRREAGSYGKDTKGIIRQHQFDKLEMETFCLSEDSIQEQNFLVAIQEYIISSLKLPYQVLAVCTGDMGFPDYRQIDINTWMPGQENFRETHSADLTSSFQSRRLNIKVKRKDGKLEFVHMNDATALAFGRMLVAILENYQRGDGSVEVPEILRSYIGKDFINKN